MADPADIIRVTGFRDGKGKRWVTLPSGYTVPFENTVFARDQAAAAGRAKLKMLDKPDRDGAAVASEDSGAERILTRMLTGR